jgi:hypothetical protein
MAMCGFYIAAVFVIKKHTLLMDSVTRYTVFCKKWLRDKDSTGIALKGKIYKYGNEHIGKKNTVGILYERRIYSVGELHNFFFAALALGKNYVVPPAPALHT